MIYSYSYSILIISSLKIIYAPIFYNIFVFHPYAHKLLKRVVCSRVRKRTIKNIQSRQFLLWLKGGYRGCKGGGLRYEIDTLSSSSDILILFLGILPPIPPFYCNCLLYIAAAPSIPPGTCPPPSYRVSQERKPKSIP